MDLEHLTKHQIVLLTLFVSFVTSIATGIVTVSLMSQAPPSVSQTINRIVERTIETVASTTGAAADVATQKTIVIKDDDLVAQSIANLQKSLIQITAKGDDTVLARGVLITNRTALTDRAALERSGAAAFEARLADGTRVPVSLGSAGASSTAIALVLLASSTTLAPAPLADSAKLRLGQSVLTLSGAGADKVGEGVIATLPSVQGDSVIEASVGVSTPGSVLATQFGEVIGIATSESLDNSPGTFALLSALGPVVTKQTPKS